MPQILMFALRAEIRMKRGGKFTIKICLRKLWQEKSHRISVSKCFYHFHSSEYTAFDYFDIIPTTQIGIFELKVSNPTFLLM